MRLGELIDYLKAQDQTLILKRGFWKPMSYRGYYSELAFEPAKNMAIRDMLYHAESAVGQTFQGYKGGDFTMNLGTEVWIAPYSESNDDWKITTRWLEAEVELAQLRRRQ